MKKHLLFTFLTMIVLIFSTYSLIGCKKTESLEYVNTRTDFCAKTNTESTIYVDDIDFGTETDSNQIRIEKSISIIGKSNKSTLKNVYFIIQGGGLETEKVTVNFRNVIFDGSYDIAEMNIDESKSYLQNFGTRRDEKRAITAEGFLALNIENCDFTRYNSFGGAAIYANYTDGNEDLFKRMSFSMKNCNVYNNFTFRGAVHFNSVKPATALFEGCNFYNNVSSYASGIYAGGVVATINGCSFSDNTYQELKNAYGTNYVTRETYNYMHGQALHFTDSEGIVKNCIFENNVGYIGGAIGSAKSLLTVDSCKFLRNTALNNGGAIVVLSKETFPTYVTNSTFIGNKAMGDGNVLYNLNSDFVYRQTKAAKVEFSLCSFAENNGENNSLIYNDTATYQYIDGMAWRDESVSPYVYNIRKGAKGEFLYSEDNVEDEILGSIVIDNHYVAKENTYTSAYTLEDALVAKILRDGDFSNVDSVRINQKSQVDKTIPNERLADYANGRYKDFSSKVVVGVNDFFPLENSTWQWWLIGSILVVGCVCLLILAVMRKRRKVLNTLQPEAVVTEDAAHVCDFDAVKEASAELDVSTIVRKNIALIKDEYKLSAREAEVTELLTEGKNSRQIAEKLFIGFDTVKFHCKNIYRKLNVHSQTELIKFCQDYKQK